jgi:hypothetical protein
MVYIGQLTETVSNYPLPKHFEVIGSDVADAITKKDDSLVYLYNHDFKKLFMTSSNKVMVCPERELYLVRTDDVNWVVASMVYLPRENKAITASTFESSSHRQVTYPEPGVRRVTSLVTFESLVAISLVRGTVFAVIAWFLLLILLCVIFVIGAVAWGFAEDYLTKRKLRKEQQQRLAN